MTPTIIITAPAMITTLTISPAKEVSDCLLAVGLVGLLAFGDTVVIDIPRLLSLACFSSSIETGVKAVASSSGQNVISVCTSDVLPGVSIFTSDVLSMVSIFPSDVICGIDIHF